MRKGMVMELHHHKAVVLTPDGAFEEVRLKKNSQLKVGDELSQEDVIAALFHRRKTLIPAIAALVAALLIFVLSGVGGFFQNNAVAAYVSVDVNPSVEASVDKNLKIVSVEAINDDGKALLKDPKEYSHESLYAFMNEIMTRLKKEGYLSDQPDLVITTTVVSDKVKKVKIDKELANAINHVAKDKNLEKENGQLTYVKSTLKDREKAKKAGLSTGKYIIYMKASKENHSLTLDQVKNMSIKEIKRATEKPEAEGLTQEVENQSVNKLIPPGLDKKLQATEEQDDKNQVQGQQGHGNNNGVNQGASNGKKLGQQMQEKASENGKKKPINKNQGSNPHNKHNKNNNNKKIKTHNYITDNLDIKVKGQN